MGKYVMVNSLDGVVDCVRDNEARLNRKISLVAFVAGVGLAASAIYAKDLNKKICNLKKELKELANERG